MLVSPSFSVDPSFPTESKAGQLVSSLVYLLDSVTSFTTSVKAFPGKWRTKRSQNIILVMPTQVPYLSHHTVQYGTHSFADSGKSGSASRLACSFGSGKLYKCFSNKCFKVYPAYSLCDRCKTLTGSPDPMYMQPEDWSLLLLNVTETGAFLLCYFFY